MTANMNRQQAVMIALILTVTGLCRPSRAEHDSSGFEVTSSANAVAVEQRLRNALNQIVEVPTARMRLQEFASFLKELGIPTEVDRVALEELGLDQSVEINVEAQGASLHSTLDVALRQIELSWLIQHERLIITSEERKSESTKVKVYDVSQLISYERMVQYDGTVFYYYAFDSLIDIITSTIEPDSWEDTGTGIGSIRGYELHDRLFLIIAQSDSIHEQVQRLLAHLRKSVKPLLKRRAHSSPSSSLRRSRGLPVSGRRSAPTATANKSSRLAVPPPPWSKSIVYD